MQKIFVRYFLTIMVATVGLALIGNFCLQTIFSQKRAVSDAQKRMAEITQRISDNEQVIHSLMVSLEENYITRAKAFAEMIALHPTMLESLDEMNRIAALLSVEEVHVTDEQGILQWGNLPAYYGLDFFQTDQTRAFLPALTEKDFALAQEPQPNGIEAKLFQYISVARQDKSGIVQVGVAPTILENALANNKIDVIIANFNVPPGVNVVAMDPTTGLVVADTKRTWIEKPYTSLGINDQYFNLQQESGWVMRGNDRLYAVYGNAGDYRLEISYTQSYLYTERRNQNIAATLISVLLGLTIIIAIFLLLKRKVIGDIELVNRHLSRITAGDLAVVVDAHATPELVILSDGINQMVESIRQHVEEVEAQADSLREQALVLEDNNRNILASLNYARKIQNNLLPSKRSFDQTFADYSILWEPRDVVGGDIYWLKKFPMGTVLCVCDCTGHGTPGALLTMLVVTALDTIVDDTTCSDPAGILWELEQRLISTLRVDREDRLLADIKDGADLCILFIHPDGHATLSSAKLHVFVCNGQTVENIKGQRISIGDGSLKSKDQIKTLTVPASPDQSFYIVSDGLFEQVGGTGNVPFGYTRFKQIVLQNHGKPETEVTDIIWNEFKTYMGDEIRRDDVTMIGFKLSKREESGI